MKPEDLIVDNYYIDVNRGVCQYKKETIDPYTFKYNWFFQYKRGGLYYEYDSIVNSIIEYDGDPNNVKLNRYCGNEWRRAKQKAKEKAKKQFKNIEEINNYYNNLGIKTYWTKNKSDYVHIYNITIMFDKLHSLYPNIEINAIGYDILYYEEKKEEFVSKFPLGKNISDPYFKKRITEIAEKIIKTKTSTNCGAGYFFNINAIFFNYKNKINEEICLAHEFGHAIAYKYDLNEDYIFIELFNNLTKEEIKNKVSEYASTNVCEFIAECFAHSFSKDTNDVIKRVRHRMDCFVKENRKIQY